MTSYHYEPGWTPGSVLQHIALVGQVPVPCKVSTQNGPILPGDMLTTSDIPGYAAKAVKAGPTVGRALEAFDGSKGDKGQILVFVDSGWYGGETAIAAGEISTSKLAEGVTKAEAPAEAAPAAAIPAVQPAAMQTVPIWWLAVVIFGMLAMAAIGYAIGRNRKQ